MNDTTRFPGKGVNLNPAGATLPSAPNPANALMVDPVDNKLKRWNGSAWVADVVQSIGPGGLLASFGGATQNIVNATPTVVVYPVIYDPENAWNVGASDWTCPETGVYEIEAVIAWNAGTAATTRNCNIQLDPLGVGAFANRLDYDAIFAAVMPAGPAVPNTLNLTWRGVLTATDKIRIRTRMDGEGADKLIGDFPAVGGTTWLSIVRDYRF